MDIGRHLNGYRETTKWITRINIRCMIPWVRKRKKCIGTWRACVRACVCACVRACVRARVNWTKRINATLGTVHRFSSTLLTILHSFW